MIILKFSEMPAGLATDNVNLRRSGGSMRIGGVLFDKVFARRGWQWAAIGIVNAAALMNYFEIAPFVYSIYAVGGFELLMRCLFSDLIAYSERRGRDYPVIWWLIALLFPPVTLLYLYFLPFDSDRPVHLQFRLDAGFASACLLYRIIPVLRGYWS